MTEHQPPGRRRCLTEEEIDLWLQVARSAKPLPGASVPSKGLPTASPPPLRAPVLRPSPTLPDYVPPISRPRRGPPPIMSLERRLKQGLARGKVAVEAVIDLHGLRQAEALHSLTSFLHQAQRRGERLVMVVTGKGKAGLFDPFSIEREAGVLRRNVPHWLRATDLRSIVVGFEEASPGHGGAGALYVRLRRHDRPSDKKRQP